MKYIILLTALFFIGCSGSSPRFTSENDQFEESNSKEVEDVRNSGNVRMNPVNELSTDEIEVDEVETAVRETNTMVLESLTGTASYYADKFHGRKTANGEVYDMNKLTAAHLHFPFGTEIKVTNLKNKRSVIVRINDRKPFDDGRVIDLSLEAAKILSMVQSGITKVKLEVLKWGKE